MYMYFSCLLQFTSNPLHVCTFLLYPNVSTATKCKNDSYSNMYCRGDFSFPRSNTIIIALLYLKSENLLQTCSSHLWFVASSEFIWISVTTQIVKFEFIPFASGISIHNLQCSKSDKHAFIRIYVHT